MRGPTPTSTCCSRRWASPTPTVDFGGNCGNMTAAVGPFAIEAGLVAVVEPITVVRIRSVNTGVFVRAHVPVRNGRVVTEGDFAIAGVPGTAARLDLEWLRPGGALTGACCRRGGRATSSVLSDGRRIEVSIVDAGNPSVFCAASSLGLTGTELPAAIEQNCRRHARARGDSVDHGRDARDRAIARRRDEERVRGCRRWRSWRAPPTIARPPASCCPPTPTTSRRG